MSDARPLTDDDRPLTLIGHEILDAITRLDLGVPAWIDQTGGGVAAIVVGTAHDAYDDRPGSVLVGPGSFDWQNPGASRFYPGDLTVGPTPDGENDDYEVIEQGATADDVAAVVARMWARFGVAVA